MSFDVPAICTCGAVAGIVRGVTWSNARRLSCMCDDCQVYAQYLGRSHDILDAHGGTDVSYATQNRVEILRGREHLHAVRLYATGILRVYAGCCRTPVAHVPSAKMAFVGIPHLFTRQGPEGMTRGALFGPLVHRLQGRFCRGELPSGAHRGTPIALSAPAMARVAWDSLRGRQRPSAFHETASGIPTMPITVLSAADLARLRGRPLPPTDPTAPSKQPLGCS